MNNSSLIGAILIITLPCAPITTGHKDSTHQKAHHEPKQDFDFDTLPLNTKLSLIIQYAHQLEERLPFQHNAYELSSRQLASNIRIFAQSALKKTPPCKQCSEVRQQQSFTHAQE